MLLNQQMAMDRYPVLGIEDIFNQIGGAPIFGKLDPGSRYHQTPLRAEDRCKDSLGVVGAAIWTKKRTSLLLAQDGPRATGYNVMLLLH